MTLMSVDVVVDLIDDAHASVASPSWRETLRGIEFLVRHTSVSVPSSLLTSWTPDASNDICVTGGISDVERILSPDLRLYAPLGGFLSSEFRTLLRHGLSCHLTRLVVPRLGDLPDTALSPNRGGSVRWSPRLLCAIAGEPAEAAAFCFTAQLPAGATLLPLAMGLRSANFYPKATTRNAVCRLRVVVQRMSVVPESARDGCAADRLALFLSRTHVRQAEQMREAGGEALQANNPQDAVECYTRMIALAQKGLRYPYTHALHPPPSFEDRREGAGDRANEEGEEDEDDIADGSEGPVPTGEGQMERRDIAPAHRVLNGLLRLRRGTWVDGAETLYASDVLAGGRWMFPRSHALLHVWYTLHRMAVVGAANAAHALLLITTKSNSLTREMRQRNTQGSQWCARAVALLRRFRSWCGSDVLESDPLGPGATEWVWLRTVEFKLLLRRARLLRSVGDADESRRVLHEMGEQIRSFSLDEHSTCLLKDVLLDAGTQLSSEKALLRDEEKQSGGLLLRL